MHAGRLILIVMMAIGGAGAAAPVSAAAGARPALLAALDGEWRMTGDVMGDSVTYVLTAGPVLAGTFTELHMIDAQAPPQYEARVFLGYDAESGRMIAHWMDVFGAKASIPHGTGRLSEDTIEFVIPYADGPFRDVLVYDRASDRWHFTIESSDGPGQWNHFAAYEIERVR